MILQPYAVLPPHESGSTQCFPNYSRFCILQDLAYIKPEKIAGGLNGFLVENPTHLKMEQPFHLHGGNPHETSKVFRSQTLHEYGSTTGRPRKIDWLDIVALHRAVRYTGTDVVHITKLDILENLDVFKLNINREIVTFPTSEEFCEEIKASLSSIPWHLEILFHRSPE